MLTSFLTFLFFISSSFAHPDRAWISSHHGNCLTSHLREAVQVNSTRGKLYSRLTRGKTAPITEDLIFLDRMGIVLGQYFDSRSRKTLSHQGLPLLCEVIPPMLPVLKNPLQLQSSLPLSQFVPFDVASASQSIHRAHQDSGLTHVQHVIQKLKSELASEPRFNCLSRQFIHSMDLLIEMARLSPSPEAESLAWDSIRASLIQLRLLAALDRRAAPFQAQGIPMICAEIPALPH